MTTTAPPLARFAVLVSDTRTPCGVESFARRLAGTAGPRAVTTNLDFNLAGFLRAIAGRQSLVVNLPVVAWKRRLIEPALAVATARSKGLKIILVLHEWADLDWKRRIAYAPLIAAAHTVLFSCPEVEAQFTAARGPWLGRHRHGLVPIPPNVARPDATTRGDLSERVARERRNGRFILGHFGSIYPKKQSTVVLDVAADMRLRGEDPFVVFAGSFIRGVDRVREDFEEHVARLGLADRVLVTGYIETEAELFGLFEDIDVFVYRFADGLTARRSSVYACLTAGQPVVVNAPRDPGAFDHHPAYSAMLQAGLLRLVPHASGPREIADAVIAAHRDAQGRQRIDVDIAAAWGSALAAVDAAAGG